MIINEHELEINPNTKAYAGFAPYDCLFFDIETTGFSAKNSMVYLIGGVYYKDKKWRTIQWFADTPDAEQNVLAAFFKFLRGFKTLINFNGDGFDIPYLRQRAEHFGISDDFIQIHSIDIFRAITPAKKFLKLANYKQKSIEVFLDILRDDKYSGGELINVYKEYIDKPTKYNLELLMLHNYDDICGLTKLLPVLSYGEFANGSFVYDSYEQNENEIIFNCTLLQSVPKRVSLGFKDFYITAFQNTMKLRVKIYSGELKFFYSNYKDYYYLPNEDMAIHKSVAFYVDKNFRTKAKAANCYGKKSGNFIVQFSEIVPTYFKIEFNDKLMYIELNDEFLDNRELISNYIKDVIKAV
jgi:hypothetical protein